MRLKVPGPTSTTRRPRSHPRRQEPQDLDRDARPDQATRADRLLSGDDARGEMQGGEETPHRTADSQSRHPLRRSVRAVQRAHRGPQQAADAGRVQTPPREILHSEIGKKRLAELVYEDIIPAVD